MRPSEITARIRFWRAADRIGPDIPWTHWRLHFKSTMRALCASRFKSFGDAAEFRPGAYAIQSRRGGIVEGTRGSFWNAVGLPVETLRRRLAALNTPGRE